MAEEGGMAGGVCGLPRLSLLSSSDCSPYVRTSLPSRPGTVPRYAYHQTAPSQVSDSRGMLACPSSPGRKPPQQSTARRWRRSSGPALDLSTERFQWCASETWIFVHQSLGPTVRQSLVEVRGVADHLCTWVSIQKALQFCHIDPDRCIYMLYIFVGCVCVRTHAGIYVCMHVYLAIVVAFCIDRLLGSRRTDYFCARSP